MLDEDDRTELLPVLTAIAAGARVHTAAAKVKIDLAGVLELALMDTEFALALLVAQNERLEVEMRDLFMEVQRLGSTAEEVAANVSE